MLLQKFRCMSYNPYILQASYNLAAQQLEPNDKVIPLIISFQSIIEKVENVFAGREVTAEAETFPTPSLGFLQAEMSQVKNSITFPISESRKFLFTPLLCHS